MRQPKKNRLTGNAPQLAATALDAMGVGASTALIIGMVGSLVFFLLIAFYRGDYDSRLMFIFGLYTAAVVLVARIAIESGRAYANAFSIPLAVVSMMAIMRFVQFSGPLGPFSWLANIAILAIAWYLADRITFDCTLISDRQRSLQQGLLQSLGLLERDAAASESLQGSSPAAITEPAEKPHNPGVWVLYFALLAFPLFGLGQLAIPHGLQKNWAFAFLMSYLACALSLLLLTSLLNIRRYLRQRGVPMPAELSSRWLGLGIGGILVLLLVCLALPLPGRNFGLITVPLSFESADGNGTSRWGWGDEGSDEQSGDSAKVGSSDSSPQNGPPQPDGKGPPQASDSADTSAKNNSAHVKSGRQANSQARNSGDERDQGGETNGPKQQAGNQTGNKQSDTGPPSDTEQTDNNQPLTPDEQSTAPQENAAQKPEVASQEEPRRESSNASPAAESSQNRLPSSRLLDGFEASGAEFFKWITMIILACIVIAYAVTHPSEVAKMWREFMAFWAALFGRQSAMGQAQSADVLKLEPAQPVRRAFSSFANPFDTQLTGWTPQQVIEHSFAAVEAWGAERGVPREDQQTAAEFARRLAAKTPHLGLHAQTAATMLDRLMFAGWKPQNRDLAPLAELWQVLRNR